MQRDCDYDETRIASGAQVSDSHGGGVVFGQERSYFCRNELTYQAEVPWGGIMKVRCNPKQENLLLGSRVLSIKTIGGKALRQQK